MVADIGALKRAYDAIKAQIFSGELPVRARIDVDAQARLLGVSSMPVRQALARLTWERLVKPGQHTGFEVVLWSAAELAHLYAWRGALLAMALPIKADAAELERVARTAPYPSAVRAVMATIEEGANPELKRVAANADDRLHAARLVEADALGDVQGEFETLVAALADRSRRAATLLRAYHRRRVERAAQLRDRVILGATPRNGG
jgi:DNA-binding FadR family transcriptional regulator